MKRALLLLAAVTVTLAPLALRLPVAVPLLPTATFPKLKVAGVTVSCPVAVTPVPVAEAVVVDGDALLVNVSVALAAPAVCGLNVTVKDAFCPAAIVTGRESPLRVKRALLLLAAVTVTLAPVALRVPDTVPLLPTTTLPKLKVGGVTESCPVAAIPVPVAEAVVVASDASLVNVSAAFAAPAVCGLNVTVKDTFCPAAIVTGSDSPLKVNRALLLLAAVTVTLAPLALRLPVAVPLLPTTTLPTSKVAGVTLNCPGAVAEPVPDNAIDMLEFDASDASDTVPLAAPVDFGLKTTLNDVLWPAASVSGRVNPLMLNAAPVTGACVIVRLEPPALVSVSGLVWLVLTLTLPKLRLVGAALTCPGLGWGELPELNPWHPIMAPRASMVGSVIQRVGVKFITRLFVSTWTRSSSLPVVNRLGKVPKGHAGGGQPVLPRRGPFERFR